MRQSKEAVANKIMQIVEEITLENITANTIKLEDRLILDLGLDSLDYASVLVGCELWLNIKVSEKGIRWSDIQTVGELAELIERNQ